MEAWPSRANRRISSKASHGFSSRLSRSARCALVSLTVSLTGFCLPENAKAGCGSLRAPAFVLRLRLVPWGRAYPTYLSGTSTQALHRGHFAVTRPVGASTRTMALRMTTSSGLRTKRVTRQTGQRPRSSLIWTADACTSRKYTLSIGIVKRGSSLHSGLRDRARRRRPPEAGVRRGLKGIGLSLDPVDAHAKWSEDTSAA